MPCNNCIPWVAKQELNPGIIDCHDTQVPIKVFCPGSTTAAQRQYGGSVVTMGAASINKITNEPDGRARVRINGIHPVPGIDSDYVDHIVNRPYVLTLRRLHVSTESAAQP